MLIQDDVYEHIINFVDEEDIMNMLSVNRKFYSEKILLRVMNKRYPFLKNFKKDYENWRSFYFKILFIIIRLKEMGIFYISHLKFNPYKIFMRKGDPFYEDFSREKYKYNKFLKYSIEIGEKNWVFEKDIVPDYGLKYAIRARNKEMIDYFLEKGDLNFVFSEVMETGDKDLLHFFLNRGVTNFNGGLIGAVKSGDIEIVRLMINKGANNFEKAIFYSLKNNFHDITNLLLEKNIKNFDEALLGAVKGGNLEMVKILIDKGATDLDRGMKYALKYKHNDIIEFLFDKDINFNYILNAVIRNGNLELVKTVLDKDIIIDSEHLIPAVKHGQIEILKLLLERRGGINSDDLFTLSFIACRTENLEMIKFLNSKEGDSSRIIFYVQIVARTGNLNIIKYFEEQGFNDYETILKYGYLNFGMIKYAIEKGAKNFDEVLGRAGEPKQRNFLLSVKKSFLNKCP